MFSDGLRAWFKDLKVAGYSFEFLIANSLLRAWFSLPTILVFVYKFSHKALQLLDSLVLQCRSPRYFERRFDVVVAGTWAASHGTTGSFYMADVLPSHGTGETTISLRNVLDINYKQDCDHVWFLYLCSIIMRDERFFIAEKKIGTFSGPFFISAIICPW